MPTTGPRRLTRARERARERVIEGLQLGHNLATGLHNSEQDQQVTRRLLFSHNVMLAPRRGAAGGARPPFARSTAPAAAGAPHTPTPL